MTSPLERAPRLPLRTLGIAVLFFALSLGSLEYLGTVAGLQPQPTHNEVSWARHYEAAITESRRGGSPVVIVGSSRALLGIDPELLAARTESPVYQLAINGGNPFPILERLRADRFRGLVVASYMPARTFGSDERGRLTAESFVSELDNPSVLRNQEFNINRLASSHFRTRSGEMQLLTLLRHAAQLRLPEPSARVTRPDRMLITDTDHVDAEALEEKWMEAVTRYPPYEGSDLDAVLAEVAGLDQALNAAGATVLWVRLPTTGTVADEERRVFSREAYYERLSVANRMHFEDDARTRELRCFDGSHLDPRDAAALTTVIAERVKTLR